MKGILCSLMLLLALPAVAEDPTPTCPQQWWADFQSNIDSGSGLPIWLCEGNAPLIRLSVVGAPWLHFYAVPIQGSPSRHVYAKTDQ